MLNIGWVFKTKYFVYHKRTRLAMECYPTIKALKSLKSNKKCRQYGKNLSKE